jgi:hypothetical protein
MRIFYLIEVQGLTGANWLCITDNPTYFDYTKNVEEAWQFARRQDAEALMRYYRYDTKTYKVTEHAMMGGQ